MDLQLLERAIKTLDNKLLPIYQTSFMFKDFSEKELIGIAEDVNKKLGYELFTNKSYDKLIKDFSLVTAVAAKNARMNDWGDGDEKNNWNIDIWTKTP